MGKTNSSGGMSVGGVLFLIFLVLKLTNVIDWSWWWVTAPLWIPISIWIVFVGLILGIFGSCFKK